MIDRAIRVTSVLYLFESGSSCDFVVILSAREQMAVRSRSVAIMPCTLAPPTGDRPPFPAFFIIEEIVKVLPGRCFSVDAVVLSRPTGGAPFIAGYGGGSNERSE